MNYYAGIGSRKTPNDVCEQMTEYAEVLMNCGMYLRSGEPKAQIERSRKVLALTKK